MLPTFMLTSSIVSSFLPAKWIGNLNDGTLAASFIVAVLAAGAGLFKLAKSIKKTVKTWIANTAKWIKKEVREIVAGELKPLKDKMDRRERSVNEAFNSVHKGIAEIQDVVSELTKNGGSHLRDTIDDIDTNVKKLLPDED